MEEQLIQEVRKNPILYDRSISVYRSTERKQDAWREIGDRLKISADVARRRWTNLKDAFSRSEKNRERRSVQGASQVKEYRYAASLEFLLPHISIRQTTAWEGDIEQLADEQLADEQLADDKDDDKDDDDYDENGGFIMDDEYNHQDKLVSPPGPTPTKKSVPPRKYVQKGELEEAITNCFQNKGTSPIDPFFIFVSETMSRFPVLTQATLKFEIHQLIHKAELELLSKK